MRMLKSSSTSSLVKSQQTFMQKSADFSKFKSNDPKKASVVVSKRNMLLQNHRESFVEQQHILYKPIYKLDKGYFTQDEWVTILMHSIRKVHNEDRIKRNLGLQLEHLSKNRIRQSLLHGLEKVDSHGLRGDIWKLLCKV